jgi:two-component system OmpR family sensor kinase
MRRANGETEQADTLDRIESEGTRMSRLVDDLLLLARGDSGSPPQLEDIDVGELIDDAVDSARAAFPQRRIDIAASHGVTLLGDRDQLLRVLRNLIANAAVHTDPDGPIQVSGEVAGDQVVLRVVDSGPGLPPDQAQHVFERFWRADKARSRSRGGSGLGLAIVAQLVQSHGGTVEFETSAADGTTVTVRLPRDGAAPYS